ncbi:MAG: AAA family ATPase [Candidatus Heimdallarchaeota archaeon]
MNKSLLPKVILISGTPGVGKTTISDLLRKQGYQVLSLNEFILANGLFFGLDLSRDSVIVDEEILQSKLLEEIKCFSDLLFIEGHNAELVPSNSIDSAFVLRCNSGILRERLESSRDYSKNKIEENINAEIMDECLLAIKYHHSSTKVFEIDTTTLTPHAIVNKILNYITEKI